MQRSLLKSLNRDSKEVEVVAEWAQEKQLRHSGNRAGAVYKNNNNYELLCKCCMVKRCADYTRSMLAVCTAMRVWHW